MPIFGVVGAEDDADASLWQPYGTRQVLYLTKLDRGRPPGLEWVVIQQHLLEQQTGESLDTWIQRTGAFVVAREFIDIKVSQNPARGVWCIFDRGIASSLFGARNAPKAAALSVLHGKFFQAGKLAENPRDKERVVLEIAFP